MAATSTSGKSDKPRTFGVEIECLAFMHRTKFDDRVLTEYALASNPKVRGVYPTDLIAECLQEFMLAPGSQMPADYSKADLSKSNCEDDIFQTEDKYSTWKVTIDPSVMPNWDDQQRFWRSGRFFDLVKDEDDTQCVSDWLIDRKIAMSWEERDNWEFQSIEIISPVLPATEEGFRAVREVFRFLNDNSFIVNESAGMHVHVANQREGGSGSEIAHSALLKLVQLMCCAEFQMNALQPEHRVFKKAYNELMTRLVDSEDISSKAVYDKIAESTTVQLLAFQYGSKKYPLNISSLRRSDDELDREMGFWATGQDPPPADEQSTALAKTIEFRSGEATLRADRAVTWIKFVTSIFRVAQVENADWEFLRNYTEHTPVEQMLRDIGLPEFADGELKLPLWEHSKEEYVLVRQDKNKYWDPVYPWSPDQERGQGESHSCEDATGSHS